MNQKKHKMWFDVKANPIEQAILELPLLFEKCKRMGYHEAARRYEKVYFEFMPNALISISTTDFDKK